MNLWRATISFLDSSGRRGVIDYSIEAGSRDLAESMARLRLKRDGRLIESITVIPLPPGTEIRTGIGISTPMSEGEVSWRALDGTPHTILSEKSLNDGPAETPAWLPPVAWATLYLPRDSARPYAIIDPSTWSTKSSSLGDEIAESNLAAVCLFEPGAEDELLELGPWLVDLSFDGPASDEPPTPFHRRVFADRSMLFLRSPLDLADFRRALRKLTRVRDVDDKWYFNRFWEPEFFIYFILFLEGRRLIAPLADLTGFAIRLDDSFASAETSLAEAREAPMDNQGDMDLLFDAGTAMVALRHARKLEAEFSYGLDSFDVFTLARERLSLDGMDYRFVAKCVEIAYSAMAFYGAEAASRLNDELIDGCFDGDGELTMQIEMVHGQTMFGLRQGIPPHLLHSELRF